MNENEKRAHDIALAALPALIISHQSGNDNLPPIARSMFNKLDVYQEYIQVYDSCLKSLSLLAEKG